MRLLQGLLVFLMGTVPNLAYGQSARHHGLAEHGMLDDPSDVFTFPGRLATSDHALHLNLVPGADTGSAWVILGEDPVVAVAAHRSPAAGGGRTLLQVDGSGIDDLARFTSLANAEGQAFAAVPAVALDLAMLISGVGARLAVTNSVTDRLDTSGADGGAGCGPAEDGTQYTVIEAGAGWSGRQGERLVDLSGTVTLRQVKLVTTGCILMESVGVPGVTVSARLRQPAAAGFEWGLLGLLDLQSHDVEFSQLNVNWEDNMQRLLVAAGPIWRPEKGVRIAASAVTGVTRRGSVRSQGVTGATEVTETTGTEFVLPGLDLAMEARLGEDWTLRGGVRSRYLMDTSESRAGNQVEERVASTSNYVARLGLGRALGPLMVDASLSLPLLTAGPYFLGGTATGLFAMLSVSYDWKPASGGAPAVSEDPMPAPYRRPDPPRYEPEPPPSEYPRSPSNYPDPQAPKFGPSDEPYWQPR